MRDRCSNSGIVFIINIITVSINLVFPFSCWTFIVSRHTMGRTALNILETLISLNVLRVFLQSVLQWKFCFAFAHNQIEILVRLQVLTTASLLVVAYLIALMMEAVSTCETSVKFYHTTRPSIPENSQQKQLLYDVFLSLPFEAGQRERERKEKVGVLAIDTTFNGRDINLNLRLRKSPGSDRSCFW
jgi:hypothetical protein